MVTTRFEDKRVYIAQQYALSICGKTIGIEIAKAIAVAARPFTRCRSCGTWRRSCGTLSVITLGGRIIPMLQHGKWY